MTPKILSPLTKYLKGERLDFLHSERIPIFRTPINFEPDVLITNAKQNIIPRVIRKKNYTKTDIKIAGVMWHGRVGQGRWVYFNFPAYTLFNSANQEGFAKLFRGVIEYLEDEIVVRKFPFLDSKNAILLYESIFYGYNSLKNVLKLILIIQMHIGIYTR